ncbi:hypothetical protein ABT324_03735 [Saccharopolyspora sp. NPDC000359]|uniref:hypothetical protein n=1 Tax=Saccharopolyspora sp. NPDC000359 TaxID=3154251 RepID=UPI003331539C
MQIDELRSDAEAGVPGAARELGRLLCIRPVGAEEDDHFPGERWLRAALAADQDDRIAANLLAARLTQQIDLIQQAEADLDGDGDLNAAVGRRQREAAELYGRVLAADPDDPGARVGLAVLREVIDAEEQDAPPDEYSYYLVELDSVSGSAGYYEELVVTDLDELRWACEHWFRRVDGQQGFTLLPVVSGKAGDRIDLDPVHAGSGPSDWRAVEIPPLTGELLPVGCAATSSDGNCYHYGYTLHVTF